MLKGQAKEDFEKWYEDPKKEHVGLRRKIAWFYTLPFSMQWGVYLEFFDSVGIHIHVELLEYGFDEIGIIHKCEIVINQNEPKNVYSRKEAQQKAIEKAVEIYNSRN